MRILITGGAGFIGSHIAERTLSLGWETAIVDDLSTGHRENVPPEAELFEVDIRDRDAVAEVFRTFRPQAVTHQAAQASVSISVREPHFDASINVLGSINMLDACVEHNVERFVFASTGGAIYGEVAQGQASVSTPPLPVSPYAASKFAVENYLRCYRHEHGLQTNVLRYANVYGPRQDPHGEAGVVAIFLKRLLAGEPIRINARREPGDEGCVRDYVHVDDVVQANIAALRGEISEPVLNVGTGVGTSTRELAMMLKESAASTSELQFGPLRPGDVERSVLCAAPFVEYFGSVKPIGEGLRATTEWFAERHAAAQIMAT